MANFLLFAPTLLKHEGGFVNHKDDPGGATNLGVTLATLRSLKMDIDGDGDVDVADLKKLDKPRAITVYKRSYWDPILLDQVKSQSVAEILFDFAVNSGVGRAVRMVKYILNKEFGGNWLLNAKVVPSLIEAINAADAVKLFARIKDFRLCFYNYRATRLNDKHELVPYLRLSLEKGGMGLSPSASAVSFIKGWTMRINSFKYMS